MSEEEEKEFRRQEIDLLQTIVAKLVLIESGQSALEKRIYYGIIKTTNRMLQKMRTEIIKKIDGDNRKVINELCPQKTTLCVRIKCKVKRLWHSLRIWLMRENRIKY